MPGPVSITNHPLRSEADAATRATAHLALVHEAERLHAAAESGFDPAAHRIRVVRSNRQLWQRPKGALILACWVWLSTGSRYRAAWTLQQHSEGLQGTWERCPWPFATKQARVRKRRQSK